MSQLCGRESINEQTLEDSYCLFITPCVHSYRETAAAVDTNEQKPHRVLLSINHVKSVRKLIHKSTASANRATTPRLDGENGNRKYY